MDAQTTTQSKSSPIQALILATIALTVNFWAWSLLGPLGAKYASEMSLNPIQLAIMLAVPVLLGSFARIPFGVLTDRLGGKFMFSAVCFAAVIPVVWLAFANSYNQFILAGILLGITGAAFAIGTPYVNTWFPPEKRGLVLGIYSMGNAGTAISGFLTPQLADLFGKQTAYLIVALMLLLMGIIMVFLGHNSPNWKPSKDSVLSNFKGAAKSLITWDLSFLYAVSFGAFVAFGVYLPVLLKVSYGLSLTDAAARAAGFILLATIARPIGGFLSDKIGGQKVIRVVFAAIALLAALTAFQPVLTITTTVAYLSLAAFLGLGNGAILALISKYAEPTRVGSVTGIVGASGGLGGFLPPLILGATYARTHSYSLALLGLSITAIIVFVYINQRFKKYRQANSPI